MAEKGFDISLDSLLEGLENFESKAQTAIRMYADTSAEKLESYAKSHRKWQDRSTDARKRLKGTAIKVPEGYRLQLAHGVKYGIYLELANEKKYAIIEPTLTEVGTEEILPGFAKFIDRLQGGK